MKSTLLILSVFIAFQSFSQRTYEDSLKTYLKNYVQLHELVKGEDRKFLQFYPIDKNYRVVADFVQAEDSKWLTFPTSGTKTKIFRVYGTITFQLNGKRLRLNLYQSRELLFNSQLKSYLFLPFTDSTNGKETYAGGRYIDLSRDDIDNNKIIVDFNKAYNPYCAYVSGVYNCPIPPKENALPVAIKAGEKTFSKQH